MAITDPRQPNNPIVLANQAFLNLTGYSAEEVIGRNCRFLQGEGTSQETVAEIRRALAERRDFTTDILNYRKDGSPFWNELHVSAVLDDAGELLYFFASQADVTEFRKVQTLEATEHRLLLEVDHRARNVLAVVNGIVRLSRSEDPKLYAAAIQQRVQTLANAHTLLSERGWHAIALDQIVRQQVEVVRSERVRIEGQTVMVPALMVQPLALVIHELLFNAMIHGALSGAEGALAVTWSPLAEAGGFELTWSEALAEPPGPVRQAGFGTMMMRAMIEKQLQGELKRDWTDQGVTIVIRVPAPATRTRALEPA